MKIITVLALLITSSSVFAGTTSENCTEEAVSAAKDYAVSQSFVAQKGQLEMDKVKNAGNGALAIVLKDVKAEAHGNERKLPVIVKVNNDSDCSLKESPVIPD